jgi:hypothetical protein
MIQFHPGMNATGGKYSLQQGVHIPQPGGIRYGPMEDFPAGNRRRRGNEVRGPGMLLRFASHCLCSRGWLRAPVGAA